MTYGSPIESSSHSRNMANGHRRIQRIFMPETKHRLGAMAIRILGVLLALVLACVGQEPIVQVSEINARLAAGHSVTIPEGIWNLTETIMVGPKAGEALPATWDRLILRGSGRTTLVAPEGLPAVQVYGRDQNVRDFEIIGNGAEGLKLGDNAEDYVGNNFHGSGLIIRNCTTGFFNGKFDASSLSTSLIKNCDVAAHISGNQDSFGFYSVTLNDSAVALWVNAQGKAITTGGVFASNELAVRVGSTTSGDSGAVVMNSPHFEWLTLDSDPAPAGSPFVLAVVNSAVTLNNAFYADAQGNYWPGAKGNASCTLSFNEGNPAKPVALGSCKIFSSRPLTIDNNGTDMIAPAHEWPFP